MSITDTKAIPAGSWAVDKTHSSIGFSIDYMAGTFTAAFSDFDGIAADGGLRGSAKVASVQVKDPNLEAALQSPEFFDAERQPELSFESKSIERDGNRVIADPYGGERFGLKLEAVVARDRFGWNNSLPSGEPALGNEVRIMAELQLANLDLRRLV
jgi:hypothetical protein